jgi:hypothetical protein
MLFLSPNENNKALASRDDVAVLKARIVQSPLAGCFRLLPFWRGRDCPLHARIRHEFLGPAACFLDPQLPLFTCKRWGGKIL